MFYVYEWFNLTNGNIFYVGKGCNDRYKSKLKRNRYFKEYIKNNNCESRIIKEFQTEDDALQFERQRILELKAVGQAECNLDYGGTGGLSFSWTDEMKEYKSKYNPMKDINQRKRMSINNPMKNPKIVKLVAEKLRRTVIIGDKEYDSVNEASRQLGHTTGTIQKWCKKGINPKNEKCRYKDEKQVEYQHKRYNLGGCRPLRYKGKIYESPIDLAKELQVHNSTICQWCRKGFDPKGNECRYLDDSKIHTYNPNANSDKHKKPIYVNGVLYQSSYDAEKELGICKGGLQPYIHGHRKNKKYICKYVNQKPSQGKSDNSTLEGSTTNG